MELAGPSDWMIQLVRFTNESAIFKGVSLTLLGLLALLFAYYLRKKKEESLTPGFIFFILIAIFIVVYGIFLVILRPQWWKPPV